MNNLASRTYSSVQPASVAVIRTIKGKPILVYPKPEISDTVKEEVERIRGKAVDRGVKEEVPEVVGVAVEDVGGAEEDVGVAVEDVGGAEEDVGGAGEDVAVAVEDVGGAEEDVAVEDVGVAVENMGGAEEDVGVVEKDVAVAVEDEGGAEEEDAVGGPEEEVAEEERGEGYMNSQQVADAIQTGAMVSYQACSIEGKLQKHEAYELSVLNHANHTNITPRENVLLCVVTALRVFMQCRGAMQLLCLVEHGTHLQVTNYTYCPL